MLFFVVSSIRYVSHIRKRLVSKQIVALHHKPVLNQHPHKTIKMVTSPVNVNKSVINQLGIYQYGGLNTNSVGRLSKGFKKAKK